MHNDHTMGECQPVSPDHHHSCIAHSKIVTALERALEALHMLTGLLLITLLNATHSMDFVAR